MKKIVAALAIILINPIISFGQDRWPDLTYDHVTAYFAEQPLLDEEIVVNGNLNQKLTNSRTKSLSPTQIKNLNQILRKKDRLATYAIMECFLPRHGIVFWDKNEKPIAWISVCFECNKIAAAPELNKNDLKGLKTFFKKIGFPVRDREEDY